MNSILTLIILICLCVSVSCMVDETVYCSASDIEIRNYGIQDFIHRILDHPFFRIVQVNLSSECEFWTITSQCKNEGCQICECDEDDIPKAWKEEDKQKLIEKIHPVDKEVESYYNLWELNDDEDLWTVSTPGKTSFIDMSKNPVGFTGYTGEDSWRIWQAVYSENCFSEGLNSQCNGKRVFYRLISGVHSAVSAFVCNFFPNKVGEGPLATEEIGPNPKLYFAKVGDFPDRVENIYFTLIFLLRAVNKASSYLTSYDYYTGDTRIDNALQDFMKDFINSNLISTCVPDDTFNEETIFDSNDEGTLALKKELKESFRKISMIMDCVGCEQCKLHAKMKISGIGTAMKILFEDMNKVQFHRNEIADLFHAIGYFSDAVRINMEMQQWKKESIHGTTDVKHEEL